MRILEFIPPLLLLFSTLPSSSPQLSYNSTSQTTSRPFRKLKILVMSPAIGFSHMQFTGQLADLLTDAGHEVHVLIQEGNPELRNRTGVHRGQLVRRLVASVELEQNFMKAMHPMIGDPFSGPKSMFAMLMKKGSVDAIKKVAHLLNGTIYPLPH